MRIPKKPAEVSYTLPQHRGQEGAPLFVYAPLTDVEEAAAIMRYIRCSPNLQLPAGMDVEKLTDDEQAVLLAQAEPDDELVAEFFCWLFDLAIRRIPTLIIGDEPFDRERHRGDVPGSWKIQVGKKIFRRAQNPLLEEDEGNSSSPLSSAVNEAITDTAPAAGVSTE